MAVTSVFFILTLVKGAPIASNCSQTLLTAATDMELCDFQNNYQYYLPQIISKTMSPTTLVSKVCKTLNEVKCMQNFANTTKACFDDKHNKGLQIGIQAIQAYYGALCSSQEQQNFIVRLTNEPKCDATAAMAFGVCGKPDIVGFVFPFNKKGCKIMRKQLLCNLSLMKASRLCSDNAVNSFLNYYTEMYKATPCGKQEVDETQWEL